ncbi:MAG: hypothetical protein QM726_04220 [Chitinophagaceae bacterium]
MQKEASGMFELLELFADEKLHLKSMTLEYNTVKGPRLKSGAMDLGPLQSKKIKQYVSVQFLESVLQLFKTVDKYDTLRYFFDLGNQNGKADPFMGHKNAEKQSQSYYASVLFDYLRNHLFTSAFHLLEKPDEYDKEVARLHKLYSRRRMFLFIGKLMRLSQLLPTDQDDLDDDIIEVIEKKLTPKLKAEKKRRKAIEEHNKNPKDCMVQVQIFDQLF